LIGHKIKARRFTLRAIFVSIGPDLIVI
jgi:hypothetical protein